MDIKNSFHFYIIDNPGFLQFGDDDRLDFINRQSTNDLSALIEDKSVTTVVTNPAGRIIDVLQLIQEEKTIDAATLPGFANTTHDYFRKRIFFNDKVVLKNMSEETFQVLLEGEGACNWLEHHNINPPLLHKVAKGKVADIPVRLIGQFGLSGLGYRLITQTENKMELVQMLKENGGESLDPGEYHNLRIEAGLPGPSTELSQEFTPLEVGMDWAISHTKGCYTGQEVIARQVNYEKITRQMAGVRLSAPIRPQDRVRVDGKNIGQITSFSKSPNLGPIALAVIKRPHFEPGTKVEINTKDKEVSGEVVPLPFPK